jgi:hypothetical protein
VRLGGALVGVGVVAAVLSGVLLSASTAPSPYNREHHRVPGVVRASVAAGEEGMQVLYLSQPRKPGDPVLPPRPAQPEQVTGTGPSGSVTITPAYTSSLISSDGPYVAVAQFRAPTPGVYDLNVVDVEPTQAIVAPATTSLTLRAAVGFVVAALAGVLIVVGLVMLVCGTVAWLIRSARAALSSCGPEDQSTAPVG